VNGHTNHDRTIWVGSHDAHTLDAVSAVNPRRRRRIPGIAAAVGAAIALSACATDAPQDTWQPAGENAQ